MAYDEKCEGCKWAVKVRLMDFLGDSFADLIRCQHLESCGDRKTRSFPATQVWARSAHGPCGPSAALFEPKPKEQA